VKVNGTLVGRNITFMDKIRKLLKETVMQENNLLRKTKGILSPIIRLLDNISVREVYVKNHYRRILKALEST